MFQPAVDLATGCLLGFEALLRWYDSAGGYVPPDVLIPMAEARGQMTALNAWVLSEACAQAARWPSLLQVAVNCSVFQLRRGEVAASAVSALERSGLNPDRLTLEVT
jgi:EAL domain-containing protein (putative c-di-GMP-specific phosphodiesterase class I)